MTMGFRDGQSKLTIWKNTGMMSSWQHVWCLCRVFPCSLSPPEAESTMTKPYGKVMACHLQELVSSPTMYQLYFLSPLLD